MLWIKIDLVQKMIQLICFCLLLCASGLSDEEVTTDMLSDEYCDEISCVGECKQKYILEPTQTRCIQCPETGEDCEEKCCGEADDSANRTLQCWQGICQFCHDTDGNWICRENMTLVLLIANSQVTFGILLIFILLIVSIVLYKICTVAKFRCMCNPTGNRRTSVGSLQQIVHERLRDAPPRYSAAIARNAPIDSNEIFLVEGFVHDSSVPPPPYSWVDKIKEQRNTTLHI